MMGEMYLEWAPKLGYTYSVFNLVYETNVASLRIWDALGFKRIGRVKGCGNLKSFPDHFIDAIIFGRELGGEGDEYVSEERFDKIRFYLKTGTYPNGSDRAEKSRLRSAATHYRLIPNETGDGDDDKLMLKGKEVISDPHKQYEIARTVHAQSHGGINKTTASIAEKYHWVRIKETVSAAIRNCTECKDTTPKPTTQNFTTQRRAAAAPASASPASNSRPRQTVTASADSEPDALAGASPPQHEQEQQTIPASTMSIQYSDNVSEVPLDYSDMPVDPQIMQGIQQHLDYGQQEMSLDGDHDFKDAQQYPDDVTTRLREGLEAQVYAADALDPAASQVHRARHR